MSYVPCLVGYRVGVQWLWAGLDRLRGAVVDALALWPSCVVGELLMTEPSTRAKQARRPRIERAALLRRLQDLVGSAKGVYQDDRSPDRAGRLIPLLDEAFEICVKLRERDACR